MHRLLSRALSVVSVGVALLAAPLACSSSSSGPSSDDFIARYCAEFAPCCAKAGLPSDGKQCRALLTIFGGNYDPAYGDACIAEIHAQRGSPTFCDTSKNTVDAPSCKKAINSASSSGSTPPGGACKSDSECAPSTEGTVRCATHFGTGGAETRKCQVQIQGKAGDNPCVGTVDGNVTSFSSSATDVPPRGYLCDLASGVFCDSTSGACTALAPIGGDCNGFSSSYACVREAYCDDTTHKCVARKATGDACASYPTQCVVGDTCDNTTHHCVQLLVDGAACTGGQDCQSGSCVNGKCGSSDSGLAFLCGGG